MKKRSIQGVLFGIVTLLLALLPGTVTAHADLDTSDPAPNAVVSTAPAMVTMTFTEGLERSYSKAELYDQAGELVEGTTLTPGTTDTGMVLELPPDLPNGTYTVLWRTMSTDDGHTAQNYFTFTIGTAADVGAAAAPGESDGGPPLWLRAASRWAALLGLAAAIAAWPIWLLVIRPALAFEWRHARRVTRLMRRFAFGAIAVALAGDVFAIAVQAASLSEGSLPDRIRSTLGDTRYGEWWFARVALLLALLIALQWVAWWWPRRRPVAAAAALALSLAAAVPYSYVAHAAAVREGRSAALLADLLHIGMASLWVGGLFALVFVLVPTVAGMSRCARREVLSAALPRFSAISLVAWATLALTGLYSAWLHIGGIDALLHTGYGKALLVKLGLLIPILLLAAFNLVVVTRRLGQGDPATWSSRFRWAVTAEAALAIAVLAAVGALTAQQPARDVVAAKPASIEVALTGGEREANLTIAPGTPGPNRFTLDVSGDPMLHETELLLRVESTAQKTGEKDLLLVHGGGTEYTYEGSEMSLPGSWDLQLIVRQPAAPEWRAFGSVDIEPAGAQRSTTPSWVLAAVPGIGGMLLALCGIAALVVAWQAPSMRNRARLAVTGAAVLAIAALVLLLGREDVGTVAGAIARLS